MDFTKLPADDLRFRTAIRHMTFICLGLQSEHLPVSHHGKGQQADWQQIQRKYYKNKLKNSIVIKICPL